MVFASSLKISRHIVFSRPQGQFVLACKRNRQGRSPGTGTQQCDFHKPQTCVARM